MKTLSRESLLFFACLMSFTANGQYSVQNDTLKIKEVVITRKQISSEQPGFKFYDIDSGRLKGYSHFFLNDVLRDETPLFIKEYGSGLTATSSFRGTSAGHTQVAWNGININDPMLGQTDFSLIPSGMIDNIMICFGGASMDLGSGAIGGIINLGNEPSWRKETAVDVAPGVGSFGRYNGLVKLSIGNDHFQSVTKAYLNSANNDFRFIDTEALPEPQWKTREHNQILNKSFMQELYFRKSENVFSARLWYQSASRNLPGTTLYGYWGEKQTDKSIRTLISYDAVKGRKEFFATAAWMLSDMVYKSQFDTLGSRNKVNTLVQKGGLTLPLGESTNVKIVLNDELNIVESDYYINSISHNNASLTLSAERKKSKWFGAALLVRETLDDRSLLIPDFSAGFEIRALRGEEHYIKLNLSRNSKIPSLNDRFWNPGGNVDLKNEYAYSFEAGYKLEDNIGSSLIIASELSYFNNYIRNMIHWYPDTSFVWVAGNIGSVNTSGFESSVSLKYQLGSFSADLNADYSFTKAREIENEISGSSDKQLIYIPKHQAKGALQLTYRNFYSTWLASFTGLTYTTSDNSESLDGYTLNSFTSGIKLNFKENMVDLRFKIDNIFNVSYQTIAYYPQPGRSYFLILSLHLKK
jgi:outer membrane cobalamin receptor